MTKMLSASGGRSPPEQGLCPWTPLGALPPDPHYRLVLCTLQGAHQPLTPSAAYGCACPSRQTSPAIDLHAARRLYRLFTVYVYGSYSQQ